MSENKRLPHSSKFSRLTRRSSLITTASLLAILCHQTATAQPQSWPSKPIELIAPFPAGGPVDGLSRFLAQKLGAELGQPVVVVNVAGAGGSIAMQRVSQAPKDGYTLGYAHTGTQVLTPLIYTNVKYDPLKDFTPIAQLTEYANILVVNAETPYKTVQDLVSAAKQKPGAINYGSAGNGASNHLSVEMLSSMTGAKFTHVPYKGSAPALLDLLAGRIPFMFDTIGNSMSYIQAGKLRPLGVTGKARDPALPNVPTIGETVPGYLMAGWTGLVAPAGVPKPVVDRLNKALSKLMSEPAVATYIVSTGNTVAFLGPKDMAARVESDLNTWAPIVKSSGAKVD